MTWQIIKDYAPAVGILLTFMVAAWNLRLTYRSSTELRFINTVTTQRVQWIKEMRDNVSRFCGAVHSWKSMFAATNMRTNPPSDKAIELLREIDHRRYLIRLQLNPVVEPDRELNGLISNISEVTDKSVDEVSAALEKIACLGQTILNNEWQKVKLEARRGKLATLADVELNRATVPTSQ